MLFGLLVYHAPAAGASGGYIDIHPVLWFNILNKNTEADPCSCSIPTRSSLPRRCCRPSSCSSTSTGPTSWKRSLRRCSSRWCSTALPHLYRARARARGSFLLGLWFEGAWRITPSCISASLPFPRRARSISCSAAGRGIPPRSTASLTAWCTRCSSRWASRCGRISATC